MLNDETPACWDELKQLASRVCDEGLYESDTQRLSELLRLQPEARGWYLTYMRLNAWLSYDENLASMTAPTSPPMQSAAVSDDLTTAIAGQIGGTKTVADNLAFTVRGFAPRWLKHRWNAAAAIATVAAVFYGAFIFISWNLWSIRTTHFGIRSTTSETAKQSQVLATLTEIFNCRWETGQDAPTPGQPLEQRELQLVEGLAKVTFAHGATIVLEGPARLQIESADRGYLHRGRLVAQVPPQAAGFTVQTASAAVVDLGTEFGVEVDNAGKTDVHVLKGEVIVKNFVGTQAATSTGVRLAAGQAVRIVKGEPAVDLPIDRTRFSQALQSVTKRLTAKTLGVNREKGLRTVPISFTHDFNDGKLGPNLELSVGGGSCRADLSKGTFAIIPGDNDRLYLGTVARNYSTVNFVFEATAIMPEGTDPWSDAFFSMGCCGAVGPQREPEAPNVLAVIRLDGGDVHKNGFETRDSAASNSTSATALREWKTPKSRRASSPRHGPRRGRRRRPGRAPRTP